jgi:single-strand DNA-binding protein
MSINVCTIAGNLGRDPELRTTQSGAVIGTLSVATTHRAGEGQPDETTWHRVVCFQHTAEACAKYLRQGDYVCVIGRIQHRSWTDKAGNQRNMTEIVAERVDFGSRKGDGGQSARSTQSARDKSAPSRTSRTRNEQPPAPSTTHPGSFDDDDIPF